jgi:hypothetical protein
MAMLLPQAQKMVSIHSQKMKRKVFKMAKGISSSDPPPPIPPVLVSSLKAVILHPPTSSSSQTHSHQVGLQVSPPPPRSRLLPSSLSPGKILSKIKTSVVGETDEEILGTPLRPQLPVVTLGTPGNFSENPLPRNGSLTVQRVLRRNQQPRNPLPRLRP